MAQIVITFNDAIATRVVNALAIHYGYSEKITDEYGVLVDNPQTKAQFVKASVITLLKDLAGSVEARQAEQTAYALAKAAAESEITLS